MQEGNKKPLTGIKGIKRTRKEFLTGMKGMKGIRKEFLIGMKCKQIGEEKNDCY
jgi:hypothetical protein